MEIKILLVALGTAMLSGFIHGFVGLGYGMIAMAILTLVMPYTDSAAIVAFALLIVVSEISWSMRKYIDWKLVVGPSISMTVGKALGIMLMMQLQSNILRIALGIFLIVYSGSQLLKVKNLQICPTRTAGLICGFLGGLLGGVFNVAGPAASIYYQPACGDDTKKYAACLNFTFVPSAVIGVIMHICYGNFRTEVAGAYVATLLGVLITTNLGVSALKRLNAAKLRKLTYAYVGLMGIVICFSG